MSERKEKVNADVAEESDNNCQLFDLRTTKGQLLFLIITVLISCLIQYLPKETFNSFLSQSHNTPKVDEQTNCSNAENIKIKRPTYAIYSKSKTDEHLKHVHAVLQRFGYKQGSIDDDWDLLWAHDFPFRVFSSKMKSLKPHQKVNHFPGCGYITSKLELSTSDIPYVPKAFKLPSEKDKFLKYSQQYPNKIFVQKNNEHRHIQIKSANEIDFNSNDTFIQEFIDDPFLVDGYKFDIGVYVIITSVNPLRVYLYKGDVLFRYCPVKYHPFDPKNVDKYIVGDDYLPSWEVPSLSYYYNELGFGMKDSFDAYVRKQNKDPNIAWRKVEDAIRAAILNKEPYMVDLLKNYKSKRNFFEMIRFDLVIDNNLDVYLMEANMSPNLSSAHFKPNTLLYEQVIYSLFNLVNIGSPIERTSLKRMNADVESMISSQKNIAVDAEICTQKSCQTSCEAIECQLCGSCLSYDDKITLHSAYREHLHKADTKRIFPSPIDNFNNYDIVKETQNLSPQNQLITRWFYGKCKMDSSWCS